MPQFSTNAGDKAGMQNIAIVITDGPVKGVSKIYVRGGQEIFRGDHLFDHALGGTGIFLACGQGGPGKILIASKGGTGFFFALHMTKIFPKRAQKHFFYMFRGF